MSLALYLYFFLIFYTDGCVSSTTQSSSGTLTWEITRVGRIASSLEVCLTGKILKCHSPTPQNYVIKNIGPI